MSGPNDKTFRGGFDQALGVINWVAQRRGGFVTSIEDTQSIDLNPPGTGGTVVTYFEDGVLVVDGTVVEIGDVLLDSDYIAPPETKDNS